MFLISWRVSENGHVCHWAICWWCMVMIRIEWSVCPCPGPPELRLQSTGLTRVISPVPDWALDSWGALIAHKYLWVVGFWDILYWFWLTASQSKSTTSHNCYPCRCFYQVSVFKSMYIWRISSSHLPLSKKRQSHSLEFLSESPQLFLNGHCGWKRALWDCARCWTMADVKVLLK